VKHLKVGDKVVNWSGRDQNGNLVSAKDYKGKKQVIYFYPKDNTPSCTVQACNLRDNWNAIQKEGIHVIGVSADSEKSHQKFADKFDLPFSLLADEEKKMLNLFGVWGEKKFMGRIYDGIHRTTFLINEKGRIIGIIDKPKSKEHTKEILEIFQKE
jgi:thioredoxin-dependent peroxiredoxin